MIRKWRRMNEGRQLQVAVTAIVGLLTLIPSGLMAYATIEMSSASEQMAELEEQREAVDLSLMAIQKLNESGSQWGLAVANEGHRDVGVDEVDIRLGNESWGNETHGGIAIQNEGPHSPSGRVVPGGGWIWIQIQTRFPINITDDHWDEVEFKVHPLLGEPPSCLIQDSDALEILEAGNPLTGFSTWCKNDAWA